MKLILNPQCNSLKALVAMTLLVSLAAGCASDGSKRNSAKETEPSTTQYQQIAVGGNSALSVSLNRKEKTLQVGLPYGLTGQFDLILYDQDGNSVSDTPLALSGTERVTVNLNRNYQRKDILFAAVTEADGSQSQKFNLFAPKPVAPGMNALTTEDPAIDEQEQGAILVVLTDEELAELDALATQGDNGTQTDGSGDPVSGPTTTDSGSVDPGSTTGDSTAGDATTDTASATSTTDTASATSTTDTASATSTTDTASATSSTDTTATTDATTSVETTNTTNVAATSAESGTVALENSTDTNGIDTSSTSSLDVVVSGPSNAEGFRNSAPGGGTSTCTVAMRKNLILYYTSDPSAGRESSTHIFVSTVGNSWTRNGCNQVANIPVTGVFTEAWINRDHKAWESNISPNSAHAYAYTKTVHFAPIGGSPSVGHTIGIHGWRIPGGRKLFIKSRHNSADPEMISRCVERFAGPFGVSGAAMSSICNMTSVHQGVAVY